MTIYTVEKSMRFE